MTQDPPGPAIANLKIQLGIRAHRLLVGDHGRLDRADDVQWRDTSRLANHHIVLSNFLRLLNHLALADGKTVKLHVHNLIRRCDARRLRLGCRVESNEFAGAVVVQKSPHTVFDKHNVDIASRAGDGIDHHFHRRLLARHGKLCPDVAISRHHPFRHRKMIHRLAPAGVISARQQRLPHFVAFGGRLFTRVVQLVDIENRIGNDRLRGRRRANRVGKFIQVVIAARDAFPFEAVRRAFGEVDILQVRPLRRRIGVAKRQQGVHIVRVALQSLGRLKNRLVVIPLLQRLFARRATGDQREKRNHHGRTRPFPNSFSVHRWFLSPVFIGLV